MFRLSLLFTYGSDKGKFTASWRTCRKRITPLFLISQILVLVPTGLKLLFSRVRRYHFHREALQNKETNKKKTHTTDEPLFQGVKLCYNNNHQEMVRLLSAVYLRLWKATSQGLTQVFTWSCPLQSLTQKYPETVTLLSYVSHKGSNLDLYLVLQFPPRVQLSKLIYF